MSQQHPWGSSRLHQSTRLTPISTAFAQDQRNTPSPSGSRPGLSPATSNFPALAASSTRHVGSRKSSAASSTSSPFSPSQPGQQPPISQLLSSRTRTIASQSASHQTSSAAALPTASHAGGGTSNSGGGVPKLVRASPSLSTSSIVGSPNTTANTASGASAQNLSRIVIAQIFLLLSQFGPIKDEKDRARWETQAEQIRKLIDSNGMEVFEKYFRRVVRDNAAVIFPTQGRTAEPTGSYQMLVGDMQKLRKDPEQAAKIAEALDCSEGDLFREFDLAAFIAHFQLDVFEKTALALACKTANKADLRNKADAILSSSSDELLTAIADPSVAADLTLEFFTSLIEQILQDPPRDWDNDKKVSLTYAIHMRFQALQISIPSEISVVLQLIELTDAQNPLVKWVQRAGPGLTTTVEACKEKLQSVETRDISYQQVAMALLYMAITRGGQAFNASNFVAALREHKAGQRLDWQDVVHAFDRENLQITKQQFLVIFNALLPIAKEVDTFDIQLLWGGAWQHQMSQVWFLISYLSCSPDELDVSQIPRLRVAFTLQTFEGASEEVKASAERAAKHPYVSLDATTALFGLIFRSSESYRQAQILGIPDAIINPHTAEFLISAVAVPKPWGALQELALKQLFDPYFLKKLPDYNMVLYAFWVQDTQWLVDRFVDAYKADNLSTSLILEHAQANGWLEVLIRRNTEISFDLAAQAHSKGLFDIEPWLQQTFERTPAPFLAGLHDFLKTRASQEIASLREERNLPALPLSVKTVYQLLWFIATCGLPDTDMLTLMRSCIQAYPRLINYGEGMDEIIDANGANGNGLPAEADRKMQEHFKNMYSGDSDVRDIINALKRYKESEDPADQDLFACMIHGLFDEYNCFGEYPLEALATTAVLFGGIINYDLLPRLALRVGLSMVLEAVQEYRPIDSMYKFGLQALLHFSGRLHEWPNYCDQLLTIPGLQGTEVFTQAQEVVGQRLGGEINGDVPNGVGLTNGNGMDELLETEPTIPKFSCIHVDPPLRPELYEEPDEDVQDKVLFVLNNVSERNLHDKIKDLTEAVEGRHHQWFASYLVEERAKMQPNFQQLYLDMLELFNDRMLWAEVLRETYVAVVRLLNSEGTLGSTERNHLKNLGGWLGSLTIARDQPIKFRNISFKDLLIEGYDTDRLLIVVPFTCKVLLQAAKSRVFRPPNPWLMEIIRVLVELYHHAELKLNQKFEIEVLCKGLELDHKTIEPSDSIRARPQAEEEYLGPIMPEMEAFSDLSIMSLNRARGPNERFSPTNITANLPDFTNQLIYPPIGNSVVPPNTLKKIFLTAVQQAIQEIIAPVVERSVTIAAISTSQLISKDFAMEPDEEKLRKASHNVVKSLSGALALVTCKEPLRMSIMNNIRLMARDLPEQALAEGQVLMFVNDNLDTVCNTVEQAAEIHSLAEIDAQTEELVRTRRLFRNTRPNEPYKDANISPWAFYIPEPYKQTTGGLNRDQLAIYDDFGRQSRGAPHGNNASQDSGRQVPDVLQDQFAAVPSLPTPAAAPAEPRQPTQQPRLPSLQAAHVPPSQQQLNGYMDHAGPERNQRNLEELLQELMAAVRDTPNERISDLPPNSPIHHIFEQLLFVVESAGVNKDTLAFQVAGQVTNLVFSKNLRRLEVEVLTHLLANLCQVSVQISRQVLLWLSTMNEDDRIFNAPVMVCLIEVGLMDMHRLNVTLAKALNQRRVAAVEMLSGLMDEVLLSDTPSALRADFALAIDALSNWLIEDPTFEIGKQLIHKLQVLPAERNVAPPAAGKKDQLEYVFEEWVHLQLPDTPKKSIAAFIYQLHQMKVMETQEDSIEFIRTCVDVAVASYEHEASLPFGTGNPDTATINVDALAKLIVSLVTYQGEEDGAVKESKAKYLDKVLLVVILVLCNHQKTQGDRFSQKVFFRLFSTILFELNEVSKDHVFVGFKADVFLVLAKAFLILKPQNFPRFTFSWLSLVAHRIFIPAMLEDGSDEIETKDRRWDTYAQLVEALLTYTGQLIKPTGESIMAQNFYRGVLRVLLVIHHDYPEFLAENHFRFINSLPMHCTQIRNLIISAYPTIITEMPDPFTAGLKVDRMEDIRQTPIIRADIDQLVRQAGIKDTIDNMMKASQLSSEDVEKICTATYFTEPKPAGFELMTTTADPVLIHAVVLYIGSAALTSQGSRGPVFNPDSPAARLFEALARELRPEARFHFVSAMTNQLRWPNTHTHYFAYAILHLFGTPNNDPQILEVQQTITRVFLERLLVHRPHPWGLITTLLEILKNPVYAFWDLPFVKAAPEVERLFNALFNHAQQSPRPIV